MSTFLKKGKKALSIGVTVTTIVWTLGLAALAPAAQAQTLSAGDLLQCDAKDVKCPKDRALYWFTSDGKRLTFPNEKTYKTWYKDFKSVTIKQLSFDELSAIPLAGNVAYRGGTRLAKITTDPKTYAVTPGNVLRHVPSESAAKTLYGEKWGQWIDDLPDVFFGNYTVAAPLKEGELPDGLLFKEAGKDMLYLMDGGKKREFGDFNAFSANGYISDHVVTVSKETADKQVAGEKVTAMTLDLRYPFAATKAAAAKAETVKPGTLEVMLGASSPAASTLIQGQANAELLQLTFNNMGDAKMTIKSLKFARLGASNNNTLSGVYLYEGARRLTDAASFSSGDNSVTFNEQLDLAKGKTTLTVYGNVAAGTGGQQIGLGLAAATSVMTKAGDTIAGTFPLNGAIHSIGTLTLGTVSFGTTTTPAAASIDPEDGRVVWENTATVNTNDAILKRFAVKLIGSIDAADIKNFRLLVDGTQAGEPVAAVDANNFVTFDLSKKPVTLKTGGRVMKVMADVKGGTSRTFQIQLRDTSDAVFYDSQQPSAAILVQANSTTFSARTSGVQTVNQGSLTVTKTGDSPSGNVVRGESGAVLARYEFVATGEKMKVESLRLGTLVGGAVSATVTLRNGAVFVKEDGVDTAYRQVGSTVSSLSSAANGTNFSLGSSMIVNPGKKMWLELRADIFDNTGDDDTAAGTVLTARMYNVASSANATRQVTGTTLDVPTANVDGNPLTVNVGGLSLAKHQEFGDQTYVAPKQNALLCKGTLKNAGDTEDINLNTLYADFSAAVDAMNASTDITQVYVKYGTKMVTARSSVSLTSLANSWSISETLKKGEQLNVEVYGDLASGSTNGDATADTVTVSVRADGTAAKSSTAVNTGLVTCQVITAASAGTLTVSEDNTTPIASQAVAGSVSDNGTLKVQLTSSRGETMYVKDLSFYTTANAQDAGVASATLWKSSNPTGPWTQVGGTETFDANGAAPGFVRWTLTGEQRLAMTERSSMYLLLKPTFVSSGQGATSGLTPTFMLADLQADGSTGSMAAGVSTLTNSSGIIVQSNSSAVYADSTDDVTGGATAGSVTAAETALTVTNNIAFAAGDLVFLDIDNGGSFTTATEELMMVLADAGTTLTVKRGVYGTTARAYTTAGANDSLMRLNNTGTNRGIVGEATTLLDTKLTVANTGSPAGSTTGATGKEVFRVVASAALNSQDPAQNKATITRIDFTNTKSGSSVANLVMYPSDHDQDATYVTTCTGLSATQWRCTLSSTGGTNEVIEGGSRTYIVRGDVGFAADGSVEFSIGTLGTADTATDTNDVLWTDGTTAQDWVDQTLKELKASSPLKNPSSTSTSGTRDTTAPTISSVTITDATADNALTVGATIVITFSEMMDPSTIGSLVPGATAAAITDGATGDIAGVTDGTEDYIQLVGIGRIGLGNTTAITAALTGAVTGALNSAGTVLTLTVTTALTLAAADGTETFLAGTAATTMTDANSNAAATTAGNAATVAALDL